MSQHIFLSSRFPILVLWILVALIGLLACDEGPQVGVIGTGNAGRVAGTVKLGDKGIFAATRLIQVQNDGTNNLVDSRSTDSSGAFLYDSVTAGVYYIEAWQDGQLSGQSDQFEISGSSKEIIVVLLKPALVSIDLRSLGEVDSVYLNYPENQARKEDSLWVISSQLGDSGLLYTKTVDASGFPVWLTWGLSNVSRKLKLVRGTNTSFPVITSIDTSSYFPSPHTMALWTFDSLNPDGKIRDLGPFHHDFVMPQGDYLTPSPHNRALAVHQLPRLPFPYISSDTIPTSLQWWNSEFQTVKIRIRVDAKPMGTTQIFGTHNGFRIEINSAMQIQIQARMQVDLGAWDWNTYASPVGTLELRKWLDFAITRNSYNQTFSLWKNNQPIPLFASTGPIGTIFKQIPWDTFSLSNSRWGTPSGRIFLDEMEILNSKPSGLDYSSQPTAIIYKDARNNALSGVGFQSTKDLDGLSIDSSDTITIGPSQSLFLRLSDYTHLFGQDPIRAQLNIKFADSGSTSDLALFEAYPSFSGKLISRQIPVAAQDYAANPECTGFIVHGEFDFARFDITSLVNRWAKDTTTNHGIIIKPVDRTRPSRLVDLRSNKGLVWSTLITWIP